jgi:hypothetical protein
VLGVSTGENFPYVNTMVLHWYGGTPGDVCSGNLPDFLARGASLDHTSFERQISDLAKLFLSADQINLYFIQIIVNIKQFCGIDKTFFFFFFSD